MLKKYTLWLLVLIPFLVFAQGKVVRVIDSRNPEPEPYDWHSHGRLGIEPATFVGSETYNRVKLREASGRIVEVPFFHFTARDLGELLHKLAKFPDKTEVIDCSNSDGQPLVNINAETLASGPLATWPNAGYLGGAFHSMNKPPVVEDILGRRAVKFSYRTWDYDTEYNAMVLDTIPEDALDDNKPFTLSAWVLHPDESPAGEPEALMSWHNRNGNDGSTMDWKLGSVWGGLYVAGMGGSLYYAPEQGGTFYTPYYQRPPAKEWTHMAYVYSGGGITGTLKVYQDGRLLKTFTSDYVPEVLTATNITKNSVTLKGYLHTVSNDVKAYVRGYIGEYDAHHFGQLRHIGQWEQMNEIGLKSDGEFEIPFEGLKPGTRYYYRMFASYNPESYANAYEQTRRWGNACGSFVTAGEDGTVGKNIPRDLDRFIFLGVQWGSKWFSSYPGPSGFFRGYFNQLKLFGTALDADQVRTEAGATAVWDCSPENAATTMLNQIDFSWKTGISSAANFVFYIDTDRAKVENRSATAKQVTGTLVRNVELAPGLTHYWCVDTVDTESTVLAPGDINEFTCTYGEPVALLPKNNSSISATRCFGWKNTIEGLASQVLFISTNKQAVIAGSAKRFEFDGRRFGTEINPDQYEFDFGQHYFWRVQTTLRDGTVIPGPVWDFTIYNYFEPEFDGVSVEPYLPNFRHRRAARVLNTFSHPILSTPRADADELREVQNGIERFLYKDERLQDSLAGFNGATIMSAYEGGPCVDGFHCGSYGGFPYWNITMHEMGHQIHNALMCLDPDFNQKLEDSFNTRLDNNAWLGAYAAANVGENMACCCHQFIDGFGRERLLREDPATFYLLDEYLPGDTAIDLHTAYGVQLNPDDSIASWENRGGIVHNVPGVPYYDRAMETVGAFTAVGHPEIQTVNGVSAVTFDGKSGLIWDRALVCGFEKNRAWSIEVWALKQGAGNGVIAGWGNSANGVQLLWDSGVAWNVGGNYAESRKKLSNGEWYHIALVFSGGGYHDTEGDLNVYINGTLTDSWKYKLDLAKEQKVYIGGETAGDTIKEGFAGSIRQIRIYNYDMGVSQLKRHYIEERSLYERDYPRNVGSSLYVDLDVNQLKEDGTLHHHPLYPASLEKGWVRSWANNGIIAGRACNDVSDLWGYSGSTPLVEPVDGLNSIVFSGKDHMVMNTLPDGSLLRRQPGTIELVVFNRGSDTNETVLEWGDFELKTQNLNPGWQHLAINPEEQKSIVYINGQKTAEIDRILQPKGNQHLHLGAHFAPLNESWQHHFKGAIAKVRIHKSNLSPEQITANAKASPVYAGSNPSPANYAEKVVVSKKPVLGWTKAGKQQDGIVYLGTSPDTLGAMGSHAPGTFAPALKSGTRYFWRIDNGPVWSFETAHGEVIALDASDLQPGTLTSWKNKGELQGSFVPAERGNMMGFTVITYEGVNAFQLVNGRTMNLEMNSPELRALSKNSFSISVRVATISSTDTSPILSFGNKDKKAQLWFGTRNADERLLTLSTGTTGDSERRRGRRRGPDSSKLLLTYTKGSNAKMACWWKWITVTYRNGVLEAWYDDVLIERQEGGFDIDSVDFIQLGWQDENMNGNIYLNQLKIFDKQLSREDIRKIVDADNPPTALVSITAQGQEVGSKMLTIKNSGTVKGDFVLEEQVDRAPEVKEIKGQKAVVLNGQQLLSSDFVLPDYLANGKPFTLEIWALDDQESNDGVLMSLSRENSARYTSLLFGTRNDPKAIDAPRRGGIDWRVDQAATQKWVHLAYVYEGGRRSDIRLYRNGKLNNTIPNQTLTTIAGDHITIGGVMDVQKGEAKMFTGAIRKVRMYDYAKSCELVGELRESGLD